MGDPDAGKRTPVGAHMHKPLRARRPVREKPRVKYSDGWANQSLMIRSPVSKPHDLSTLPSERGTGSVSFEPDESSNTGVGLTGVNRCHCM